MKSFKLLVLSVSIPSLLGGGSLAGTADSLQDGFTPLFNGKNWDGWDLKIRDDDAQLANKVFTIDDGMVHVFKDFPDEYELNTGQNRTHGMIYTKKKYSCFIFRFEYKWGKKIANNFDKYQYDAGCYYHVYDDRIWPKGIEYQVRFDHTKDKNHTGDFWAAGTQFQWFSGDGKSFLAPADGGEPQPKKGGEHLALASAKANGLNDEWNQCEVIVMGKDYAIHKLNGIVVNLATDLSIGEGLIGLQSETAEIFYRNIEIKELPQGVAMEEFLK